MTAFRRRGSQRKGFPRRGVGNSVHVKANVDQGAAFRCPRLRVRNSSGQRANDILGSGGGLGLRFRHLSDGFGDGDVRLLLSGSLYLYR